MEVKTLLTALSVRELIKLILNEKESDNVRDLAYAVAYEKVNGEPYVLAD